MQISVASPDNPYKPLFDVMDAKGVLRNWVQVITEQCRPDPSKPPRYAREELQNRVKGTDRWGDVDQQCADVGDLYGFDAVFIDTGIAGHPQIMSLVHKGFGVVVTFHKTNSPGQVKGAPRYVQRLITETQNKLLYLPDEQEDLEIAKQLEGMVFVQITYGFLRSDRLKQRPAWITFGIPDGSAQRFFFQKDLLPLYPEFGPPEEKIDLNEVRPTRRFTTRPARKEGSDSQ